MNVSYNGTVLARAYSRVFRLAKGSKGLVFDGTKPQCSSSFGVFRKKFNMKN
jgi:hypothetical protein